MATTYKGVRIPTSARDLELYSTVPGRGAAARAIADQLKADITRLRAEGKGVHTVPAMAKLIGRVYKEGVERVLARHSRCGAYDSEPCYHVQQALVDAAKAMLNIDWHTPELADWL